MDSCKTVEHTQSVADCKTVEHTQSVANCTMVEHTQSVADCETVEHTQSVANRGEVERNEVPIGPLHLIPNLMGALPKMVPSSTSKMVSQKNVDTIMCCMALPIVVDSKKRPLWDMCAGENNVPAPPQWNRGTPSGGAIPWQQDFLTSREVHAGLREQTVQYGQDKRAV